MSSISINKAISVYFMYANKWIKYNKGTRRKTVREEHKRLD